VFFAGNLWFLMKNGDFYSSFLLNFFVFYKDLYIKF
jgi:hypothetical protein